MLKPRGTYQPGLEQQGRLLQDGYGLYSHTFRHMDLRVPHSLVLELAYGRRRDLVPRSAWVMADEKSMVFP